MTTPRRHRFHARLAAPLAAVLACSTMPLLVGCESDGPATQPYSSRKSPPPRTTYLDDAGDAAVETGDFLFGDLFREPEPKRRTRSYSR
ncbi:MAG: hypothetical protein AAF823_15100 [Planctomycetota bacterium]